VVNALKKGYAAGQLLQSAGDGNSIALSQVHALLQTHHAQAIHAAAITPKPPPRVRVPRPAPYPGAPKVLDVRPLPKEKLSGKRYVPKMAFADNGNIPFLRFRKPQSVYLSRVLRQKTETKGKRVDMTELLKEDIALGWSEAEWESIVCDELEREGKEWDNMDFGTNEQDWVKAPYDALGGNYWLLDRESDRKAEKYERMVDIVDQERRLAGEEGKQRRHEKREAKWVKKKEKWAKEAEELNVKLAKEKE
jgi:hypothetical protein